MPEPKSQRIPPRHTGYRPSPSTTGFDPATDPRPAPPAGRGGGSHPPRAAENGGLRLVEEPGYNTMIWMAVATLDDGTEIRMRNLGDRVEIRTWDTTRSCRPPALDVDPLAGRHVIDVRPIPPVSTDGGA